MKDVTHVDLNDKVVGSGKIDEAFEKGLAVRIARIFIIDGNGKLLLQKRSAKMVASPFKWDQSAAGHVDKGETYLEAAKRELKEEMGVGNVKLTEASKFYTEDEYHSNTRRRFNVCFYGTYSGKVKIDNKEVSDYEWINLTDLEQWFKENPEDFTGGFLLAFAKVKDYLYSPSSS